MGSTVVAEKTEEELRKEIDELYRQQREITVRLRDPRGVRRGGIAGTGPRNFAANGGRNRGFVRPAERADTEDLPLAKRRLSSAVVKVNDGETVEGVQEAEADLQHKDFVGEVGLIANANVDEVEKRPSNWASRDGNQRPSKMVQEAFIHDIEIPPVEPLPRVLPKNEDPSLVSRNKRMLGQLLGTLEQFRKEDKKLSSTEAYMKRSDSLKRAEQRAREESENLKQQEREQIAEKRKRDMILKARIAAKAEEKKLELLFLRWSEHHKKLGNFIRLFLILVESVHIRNFIDFEKVFVHVQNSEEDKTHNSFFFEFGTKAEPPIYYMFAKPLDQDPILAEQEKEKAFQEWKAARREELSHYQGKIAPQYVANVDKELENRQNVWKGRRPNNNDAANLQETMDKELETHQLQHGPKTRIIPGPSNEDEDDVEDINAAEDDMMDDVLGDDDNLRRAVAADETVKVEAANGTNPPKDKEA